MRRWLATLLCLALLCASAEAPLARPADGPPRAVLTAAIDVACEEPPASLERMAARFGPGARAIVHEAVRAGRGDEGWRRSFTLPAYGLLEITRYAPGGTLRHISIDYAALSDDALRPTMMVIAGPDCAIVEGRRLRYDRAGLAAAVEILDANLEPRGRTEPLNPPLPPVTGGGPRAGPVTVALVDSGVNYLLPGIAAALARDDRGRALGYDYWDLDPRPFDGDTTRSPFFPERRGTRVASLLLREAPETRLIPYRFPRPDPRRMGDLLADAAANGADILLLTYATMDAAAWLPFARAAAARPDLLVVVAAGNEGRDIDREPVYPAALGLANLISVTATGGDGTPLAAANWGPASVHLMVAGENVAVTDFTGEPALASGTEIAAARVAALAARLKSAHPGWQAADLMRAMFARAEPAPAHVRHGLIADPTAD